MSDEQEKDREQPAEAEAPEPKPKARSAPKEPKGEPIEDILAARNVRPELIGGLAGRIRARVEAGEDRDAAIDEHLRFTQERASRGIYSIGDGG